MSDDFAAHTGTTGTVAVGGSVTGVIEKARDVDWFAVELVAGRTYLIDLRGAASDGGSLADTMLHGLFDDEGNRVARKSRDGGMDNDASTVFTATETGTHYIAARGETKEHIGTYTLSVAELTDDFAADTGTTGAVAVGGSATGVIEKAQDVDWFAVELVAGRIYLIDLVGSGTDPLADTMLRGIFDDEGNNVARKSRDGGEGSDARIFFTATETGTHYIAARGETREHTGTYTVRVSEYDPDGQAAGAADLGDLGGARVLRHDSVDGGYDATDYYRFTLSETQAVTLVLRGQDAEAGFYLEHGDGNVLHSSTRGGTRREKIETTLEAGTYYVRVTAEETGENTYTLRAGARDPESPNVSGSVSEPKGLDFSANTSTAGRIAIGDSATGYIETRNDIDWFVVTLEAGKAYRFDMKGWPGGDNTLPNPYLRGIHDADGNLIAGTADNDSGPNFDSRVFFVPEDGGTYYLAAGMDPSRYFGIDPNGDTGRGTYTLSVAELTDDFAADIGTTGAVAVGGSVAGAVEMPRDRDWFAVTLKKGETYRIDMKAAHPGDGALAESHLFGVYDGTGTLLAGPTKTYGSHSYDSWLFFTAAENATYYVAAGAKPYGNFAKLTGAYNLSVTRLADDFAADTGTAGTVAIGGSATGAIEHPDDRDWFKVTLEKGKTYRFDLEAKSLPDPYLRGIHDADGNLIADTWDNNGGKGNDSQLYFTATDNATYYVAAGDGGAGGLYRTGSYTLSVTAVTDDFGTATATAGTVAVGGSATGTIDYANDRDWFAVNLEKGKSYRFDLKGSHTGDGTLKDPYLLGIRDAKGALIAGTTDDDGGPGRNSEVHLTPTETGSYYVAATGDGNHTGTYTLEVQEQLDAM